MLVKGATDDFRTHPVGIGYSMTHKIWTYWYFALFCYDYSINDWKFVGSFFSGNPHVVFNGTDCYSVIGCYSVFDCYSVIEMTQKDIGKIDP